MQIDIYAKQTPISDCNSDQKPTASNFQTLSVPGLEEIPKSKSTDPKAVVADCGRVCTSPNFTVSASTREESMSNPDSIFEVNPFENKTANFQVGTASKFGATNSNINAFPFRTAEWRSTSPLG
jgi:hypothetical protein